MIRSPITTIPRDTLTLSVSCREVETLETIDADWQDLRDLRCEKSPALKSLPPRLQTIRDYLVLDGCSALASLPEGLSVSGGVSIRWCTSLRRLPPAMPPAQALELFRSGLESIPKGWAATKLTWHGRVMTERQLFQTGTYRIEDLLGEADKDVRRILIDRYPLARLVSSPLAVVLDEDREGDISRRLITVPVPDDEAVVALVTRSPGSVPVYRRVAPQLTKIAQAVYALGSVGEYQRWGWR